GDVAEGVEGAEVLGFHHRRARQPLLERREDLDTLDRIDPEVGVERQVQVQALRRVTGLLRNHRQERGGDAVGRRGLRGGWGGQRSRGERRGGNHRPGRGYDRRRNGRRYWRRSGGRESDRVQRHAGPEARQEERLLLLDEGLQRPLGRLLRLQELLVQRRRLLLHPLQRGEALLGHQQGLGERVRVRVGHGNLGGRDRRRRAGGGTRREGGAAPHGRVFRRVLAVQGGARRAR